MANIDLYAFMGVKYGKTEDKNSYRAVKFLRHILGYKVPKSYKELMKIKNGDTKPRKISDICTMTGFSSLHELIDMQYYAEDHDYPNVGVYFAYTKDDNGLLLMNYQVCFDNKQSIWWLSSNHQARLLANSFEDFITQLDSGDFSEAGKTEELDNSWYEKDWATLRLKGYDSHDAQNKISLGLTYYNEKQYDAAAEEWQAPARAGYADAQCNLGLCYQHGHGVEQNEALAVRWFRKAVEQGHDMAQCNLGTCYQHGQGVEKDEAEAVRWYHKAAEQNNSIAQCNLGICYQNGYGVEKDETEAVDWFCKAAEQDNALAQRKLGDCYKHGEGIEKDEVEAMRWYRKAAENVIVPLYAM
ncbi:MAG: hypothetical protein LBV04_02625, partial [Deferribacteraceae bacterium]|nr:hypothetical protein [Deferribacteraceae bacterium]